MIDNWKEKLQRKWENEHRLIKKAYNFPSSWTFTDFYNYLEQQAKKQLNKQNESAIEELNGKLEAFANAFEKLSIPLSNIVAKSYNKMISQRRMKLTKEDKILKLMQDAYRPEDDPLNLLLGKSNLIKKEATHYFDEDKKKSTAIKLIRDAEQLISERKIKLIEQPQLKELTERIKQYMKEGNFTGSIEDTKKLIELIKVESKETDKSFFLANAFALLDETQKTMFLRSISKSKMSKQGTQNLTPVEDQETQLSQQQEVVKKEYEKELSGYIGTIKKPTVEEQQVINQMTNFEEKGNYSMALAKLHELQKLHENIIEINSP